MNNYQKDNAFEKATLDNVSEISQESQIENSATFIAKTYQILTVSLIFSVFGSMISMMGILSGLASSGLLIKIAICFGVIFGIYASVKSEKYTLACALLYLFTFLEGLFLGPLFSKLLDRNMGHLITNAFVLTAAIFTTLTIYAMRTKTDFSSLGKPLFYCLIVIIILDILNFLFFHSTMASLAISTFSAIVFSFYILYDTQNVVKNEYEHPVLGALSLYLDILNLFLDLLRIFVLTSDDE